MTYQTLNKKNRYEVTAFFNNDMTIIHFDNSSDGMIKFIDDMKPFAIRILLLINYSDNSSITFEISQ